MLNEKKKNEVDSNFDSNDKAYWIKDVTEEKPLFSLADIKREIKKLREEDQFTNDYNIQVLMYRLTEIYFALYNIKQ